MIIKFLAAGGVLMLIKLNGLPWDDVKTPSPEFNPSTLIKEFSETAYHELAGYAEIAEIHRTALFEQLDKFDYWLMSKTTVTDHIYQSILLGRR